MSTFDVPEVRYARSVDGVDIAYQTFGRGVPFVALPPVISHVEVAWDDPDMSRFNRTMSEFCQMVCFDKRGQGLSDRISGLATLEQRADDCGTVIDAVGLDQVALGGISEGGLMACYYAAHHPERVSALVLFGTAPRFTRTHDYPIGPDSQSSARALEAWAARWGTDGSPSLDVFATSKRHDAAFRRWLSRYERASSTPRAFHETMLLNLRLDVRPLLGRIQAPTLVMHRRDDPLVPVEHAYYVAAHIPDARLVILEGADHSPCWGDQDAVLDELREFLTGARAPVETDRVLTTVLFTDVVDSTLQATALGDRKWRAVLDDLDRLAAAEIERQRGRIIKQTGDGHLATFDGPARAVRAAQAIAHRAAGVGVALRAGVHTGEVELRGDDIGGIAVNIAARVASRAQADEIYVSRTVTDLVAGSGLSFRPAGVHTLKGVEGDWPLFAVAPD